MAIKYTKSIFSPLLNIFDWVFCRPKISSYHWGTSATGDTGENFFTSWDGFMKDTVEVFEGYKKELNSKTELVLNEFIPFVNDWCDCTGVEHARARSEWRGLALHPLRQVARQAGRGRRPNARPSRSRSSHAFLVAGIRW